MRRGVGAISSMFGFQPDDGGASPTTPLQLSPRDLVIAPIPHAVAAELVTRYHYLHSAPAAVKLSLGVFVGAEIRGTAIFTAGPINAFQLVEGATQDDCWTLARLWIADELPRNSESRVLAIILRALRRCTAIKIIASYADPAVEHDGIPHLGYVYQACNFAYTGLSEAQPLMAIGDAPFRHTRSIASVAGTHSRRYFELHGLAVRLQPTIPKHRYLYFVDPDWRSRLRVPVLPYPKKEVEPRGSA